MRREKIIGSSLQAVALLSPDARALLGDTDAWADICITSGVEPHSQNAAAVAPGQKCERCWRVLPEVGTNATHPALCVRCCEAVGA
jgi:isoleucyl-tRNA synthetase